MHISPEGLEECGTQTTLGEKNGSRLNMILLIKTLRYGSLNQEGLDLPTLLAHVTIYLDIYAQQDIVAIGHKPV